MAKKQEKQRSIDPNGEELVENNENASIASNLNKNYVMEMQCLDANQVHRKEIVPYRSRSHSYRSHVAPLNPLRSNRSNDNNNNNNNNNNSPNINQEQKSKQKKDKRDRRNYWRSFMKHFYIMHKTAEIRVKWQKKVLVTHSTGLKTPVTEKYDKKFTTANASIDWYIATYGILPKELAFRFFTAVTEKKAENDVSLLLVPESELSDEYKLHYAKCKQLMQDFDTRMRQIANKAKKKVCIVCVCFCANVCFLFCFYFYFLRFFYCFGLVLVETEGTRGTTRVKLGKQLERK